jgi:hypothetical protein
MHAIAFHALHDLSMYAIVIDDLDINHDDGSSKSRHN